MDTYIRIQANQAAAGFQGQGTAGRTGRTEGRGHRGAVCQNPQVNPTYLP